MIGHAANPASTGAGCDSWRGKTVGIPATFEQLAAHRVARVDPAELPMLERHGIAVRGDTAVLDEDIELLDAGRIRDQLGDGTRMWLKRICVRPHIDSTNAALMRLGLQRDIDGEVLIAEVQTAGRGRRGREWISPFGRNLAMSLGLRIDRPLREIGAAGLAVGLAVAGALEQLGVRGAKLKWPNDVVLGDTQVVRHPDRTACGEGTAMCGHRDRYQCRRHVGGGAAGGSGCRRCHRAGA